MQPPAEPTAPPAVPAAPAASATATMPSSLTQSTTTSSSSLKSRKKRSPYVAIACVTCKQRKTKCSGQQPCKRCRDSDTVCVYGRAARFQPTDDFAKSITELQPTSEPRKSSRERASFRVKKSPAAPLQRSHNNVDTDAQTRHANSDYFLRQDERRLGDLSPGHVRPLFGSGRQQQLMIGSHIMQQLIDHRKTGAPPGTFAPLDKELWIRIIDIYEEEVALQYPFLDLELLRRRIRASTSHTDNTPLPDDQASIEDILSLVLSVASSIVDPGTLPVANNFVESLFSAALLRTQLGAVNKTDLSIIILASIFFFLNDKEMLAWRAIGNVLRSLHEIIAQNSQDLPHPTSLDQLQDVGEKFYWTVYTLDRRWGFGTGLPFSVHDSDIHRQPQFKDDSLSSTYLRQMIEYSIISAEVRRSILQPSSAPCTTVTDSATTRNLLDFQVTQFQRNIPKRLQFFGLQDRFDPSKEKRGEYRLRLVLYLRCNQMRIVILRKSAMSSAGGFDTSTTNVLAETSQDTIRILIALAKETDIYHAQQRTFNHFLETALASLLLLLCYAEAEYRAGYLQDVLSAMELVQHLSVHSPITRALKQKLHRVQSMLKAFRASNQTSAQQSPRPGSTPVGEQFGDVVMDGGRDSQQALSRLGGLTNTPTSNPMPPSLALVVNEQQQPIIPPSGHVFPPASALAEIAMAQQQNEEAECGSLAQGLSQPPLHMNRMNMVQQYDDGLGVATSLHSQPTSNLTTTMDFHATPDLNDLPTNFFTLQPDLGEIIKDYDNFRF